MRYFLDTNALVAFGNGDEALGVLLHDADYVGTSVVCKLEYLSWPGLTDDVRERFLSFLGRIHLVGLGVDDVSLHERIVALRRERVGIKLPDAVVVASALSEGSVLLTRDKQILNAGLCETQSF